MVAGEVRSAVLWGADHEALGEVAVSQVTPSLAVALSPGRFAKGYPHVDLNEDGALAATNGSASVLAVVDGHNGFDAARAALQATMDQVPYLLSQGPGASEPALRRCFAAAADAVAAAVEGLQGDRAEGGAALTVALLWPFGLAVTGLGDCVAVRIRKSRVRRVGRDAPFLTARTDLSQLVVAGARVRSGDRVLVVTDGVRDFLGRAWKRRLAEAAADSRPADLADAAIEGASRGGAGDNLAVVVAAV